MEFCNEIGIVTETMMVSPKTIQGYQNGFDCQFEFSRLHG